MPLASISSYQVGDGNINEVLFKPQAAQVVYTAAAAPLLTSDLVNGLIGYNAAGANNLQLPLATDLDAALPNAKLNDSFDFSVVATGAGTATVTTNTGWTLVGAMAVATGIAIRYRARKTGAGAWTLYQIS
jgi:hypothetical protein